MRKWAILPSHYNVFAIVWVMLESLIENLKKMSGKLWIDNLNERKLFKLAYIIERIFSKHFIRIWNKTFFVTYRTNERMETIHQNGLNVLTKIIWFVPSYISRYRLLISSIYNLMQFNYEYYISVRDKIKYT